MKEENNSETALKKAMALCAGREYCTGDIREKLHAWGITGNECDRLLAVLIKQGFIDDNRYASAYASDRLRQNKWGKIKIAAMLRSKGIDEKVITNALNNIDNDEYQRIIKEEISSHRRTVKSKNRYDLKGKLLRFGMSRGYESHILYDLLNDLD